MGLGDNIHQRAIIRAMLKQYDIWLRTPWPSVYWDFDPKRLHLMPKPTSLRTQVKNTGRERSKYTKEKPPIGCDTIQIWYTHDGIRRIGTFLGAMAYQTNVTVSPTDFELPIHPEWRESAARWREKWQVPDGKRIMLYRPLVERTEWAGCAARNPEPARYVELAKSVSSQFFVVGVADLHPGIEWRVSPPIDMQAECFHGELDFGTLAALASDAGLVFCSPGFMLVLAQAVGAPLVTVFGGHESARFYDHGYTYNHFIQPIEPCECFSKTHRCVKTIHFSETEKLQGFVHDLP